MSTLNAEFIKNLKERGVELADYDCDEDKILDTPIKKLSKWNPTVTIGSIMNTDIPTANGNVVPVLSIDAADRIPMRIWVVLEVMSLLDADSDYTIEKYALRSSGGGYHTTMAKSVLVDHFSDVLLIVPKKDDNVRQAIDLAMNEYESIDFNYSVCDDLVDNEFEKGIMPTNGNNTLREIYNEIQDLIKILK